MVTIGKTLPEMCRWISVTVVILLLAAEVKGQDPQLSQFFASPLYLNPGYAGATQYSRINLNYRNQWPGLNQGNFNTYAVSFDHFFTQINSGAGFFLMHDRESSGVASTFAAVQYAYQIRLNRVVTVRPGLQFGYGSKSLDYLGMRFPDQFGHSGYDPTMPTGENQTSGLKVNYTDISTGTVIYSDYIFAGISAHHLNRPYQNLTDAETYRMPVKYSVHGGIKIAVKHPTPNHEPELYISPVINYKFQGKFEQLDAGLYFDRSPFVFGLWYRGLPVKLNNRTIMNNDALFFLLGIKIMDVNIGYSYDVTISNIKYSSGGSHELSLRWNFNLGYRNQKPPKMPLHKMIIPCPEF
jgi:type IX secretion system PorP/SprF family membrane protein